MSIGINLNSIKHDVVESCFKSLKSADGAHVKVLKEIVRAYLNGEKLNGYEIAKRIEGYGKSTVYKAINELKDGGYVAVVDRRRSRRGSSETDLYGPTLLGLVAYMVLVDYDLNILNKYFGAGSEFASRPFSEEYNLAKRIVERILGDDVLKILWTYVMLSSIKRFPELGSFYKSFFTSP